MNTYFIIQKCLALYDEENDMDTVNTFLSRLIWSGDIDNETANTIENMIERKE